MAEGKKSTTAAVNLRVEEVLRILLDGAQFHDVRDYAAEKGWGVSDSQLKRYIAKANDRLVVRQKDTRRKTLARHLARRETLYARCVNTADYRTALAVLADLAKLRGLYPAPKPADPAPPPAPDTFTVVHDDRPAEPPAPPPDPLPPPAEGVGGG